MHTINKSGHQSCIIFSRETCAQSLLGDILYCGGGGEDKKMQRLRKRGRDTSTSWFVSLCMEKEMSIARGVDVCSPQTLTH